MAEEAHVIWSPQPGPQASLVNCPIFEVFYGGSRGGGKTDGMIGGEWPLHAQRYGRNAKGIFFRREMPQLEAAIERSKDIYYKLGAEWLEQKKTWIFPNGALLKFRPLERDKDAEKYQGHDYTRVYFEELTNYPDPKPVNKIKATLRSGAGVPCGFRATGNPGGPGHNWVKARYIDPAPSGMEILTDEFPNPITGETDIIKRIFIPAKLKDNKILVVNDPGYVARLHSAGNEQLVKAWLEGDWNIVDGAFFDNWSDKIVLRPFEIPDHWLKFVSMDWGSAKPFSIGWWSVASEDYIHGDFVVPKGALIRYREWYGCEEGKPDTGLKLTAEQVGQGIKTRTKENIHYYVCDPAMMAEDGGPSISSRTGIPWKKADNKRVAGHGRIGGWDQMRDRINGMDEKPMIYCFNTCKDSIRTIPVLQHDENMPEDLNTSSEDHAADEWRYACMSRPWVKPMPSTQLQKTDSWGRPQRQTSSWRTK